MTTLPPSVIRRFAGRKLKTAGVEGTYYVVLGRSFVRLTKARLGLPAMYAELARRMAAAADDDRMPFIVAARGSLLCGLRNSLRDVSR